MQYLRCGILKKLKNETVHKFFFFLNLKISRNLTQQVEHLGLRVLLKVGLQEVPQEARVLVGGLVRLLAAVLAKVALGQHLLEPVRALDQLAIRYDLVDGDGAARSVERDQLAAEL